MLVNRLGVNLNESEVADYFKKDAHSMYDYGMMLLGLKKMKIWLLSIFG